MKPYAIGAGVGLVIGLCAGWYMREPVVKVEERIITKTETKWRTNERIVTLPGATVYRDPDGSMTITGPVEITATRSGEEYITNDITRKTEACPKPPDYTIAGGAMLGIDGITSYGGFLGRRMVGPVWLYVGAFAPPVRGVALVGGNF